MYIKKEKNLGYKTHWRKKQSVNPRVTSEQKSDNVLLKA